jgi:EAL domain-containing protein (putative c-di-GMP-specific phosphodiesterase class I)
VPALEVILDILASRLANLQSVTSMRTGETIVLVSTAPRSHFDAISLADRAARTIARPVAIRGSDVTATVGIGVRMSRHGMSDARRLLRDAVDALDEAQGRGPSQIAMFSSGHRNRQREGDEICMQFEPVVSLRRGHVHNYEATVPPGSVPGFGEADTAALEVLLDHLGKAMTEWPVDVDVSFNVSPSQLFDTRFPLPVLEAADRYSLAPDRFVFEIDERHLVEDLPLMRYVLGRLNDDGWRVGIDLVEVTGASPEAWTGLPVQFVKIDCALRGAVEPELWDFRAISAARALQIATIGKGIGALPELALAIAHEYDFAQGSLFGTQPANPSESQSASGRDD